MSYITDFDLWMQVGSRLLIRVEGIQSVLPQFRLSDQPQQQKQSGRQRQGIRERKASLHQPLSSETSKKRKRTDEAAAGAAADEDAGQVYVRGFLNVTSAMHATDGLVCVAVDTCKVRLRNAVKKVQNLYVGPQDLVLVVEDDEESLVQWQEAIPYIVVA